MKKPRVIQNHHLVYPSPDHPEQEVKEPVFVGEHKICSEINWYTRKTVSKGFIKFLKFWIVLNEERAISLGEKK